MSREQVRAVVRRLTLEPVTPDERTVIIALFCLQHFPTTGSVRKFVRNLQKATDLTHDQRQKLWRVAWRFRRHLPESIRHRAETHREWAFKKKGW